jgi:hypothetical protein
VKTIRLRLLVGKIDDEGTPVVAASVDESIYDVAGEDAWNPQAIKDSWPPDYEWREVIVSMSAPLVAAHFDVPEIGAIVHAPARTQT